MSTGIKILIGFFVVVVLTGLIFVGTLIGTYNQCISREEGIKAQYSQNQSNYDNMWKKFREATQVSDIYTSDLQKVYNSAIQNRYGKDGSKAVFQWLQEHNPSFDASLYKQIQVMIESGRNSFESNQKMLIDKKQVYEIYIKSFPNNMIAGAFGFPKIDLAKYDIVTSDATVQAFESKKADEIKLR